MTTEVLLFGVALIGGLYFVMGGATYGARLARATVVCVVVGLLIAAWF